MPPPKVKPDYGINFDATEKFFLRSLIFFAFSWSTTWGGFQKISEAPIKTGLFIPYLVKGTENFLPEGLIFRSSRDLPLEGRFFPVVPVKTVLPIPKLVRGLKKLLQGLISCLSRDLPLEGQIFPATPIKSTLPTHPLVRGYIEKWRSKEIFSPSLNFSPFPWSTTWERKSILRHPEKSPLKWLN